MSKNVDSVIEYSIDSGTTWRHARTIEAWVARNVPQLAIQRQAVRDAARQEHGDTGRVATRVLREDDPRAAINHPGGLSQAQVQAAPQLDDWQFFGAWFRGPRPQIVCLCGSSRFYDEYQQAYYDLTMQGRIVLSVGFVPDSQADLGHGEGVGHDPAEKIKLDELHKRKIDLADEVLVLNVDGYVGESTAAEIEYARKWGKPIRYLEDQ